MLQSKCHHQQTNTQLFTGWMAFCHQANSVKTLKAPATSASEVTTVMVLYKFDDDDDFNYYDYYYYEATSKNIRSNLMFVRYVKEQLTDDSAHPPCYDGHVVCWV